MVHIISTAKCPRNVYHTKIRKCPLDCLIKRTLVALIRAEARLQEVQNKRKAHDVVTLSTGYSFKKLG